MLTLSEKLLLLGLNDEKGSVVFSASISLDYGLAGALLLELHLAKRIGFEDKKIIVLDPTTTQNTLLDEALALIVASDKPRDANYWLNKVRAKVDKIQARLAERLVAKKILEKQEQRFLWLIKYERFPTEDPKPETDIRNHLKRIVLQGAAPSDEDVALLSLVQACGLTPEVFERSEQTVAKQFITELAQGDKISKAIKQTVEEITVALVVVLTTTTATTTIVS
ncbi:GPP34 family phosphoprotein [Alteromonas sp. ASW11-36]|uniref:GPP34 family phosphoprotein n=1 Tax=Alteromonas arenosi TaxID=3055817 RepID=A0ABT7SZJ3_9ALTE|nr:GPP34 family phosphoprotein [Alteromonas sp. ASW11-36]MDM7860954.1 GPP34 family phosphoprotein [Alteromonas sp. ASW11-36]